MSASFRNEVESRRAELTRICAELGVRRLELFGSGTRSASSRKRRCFMRLEARKYLHDAQNAADRVARFCAGNSFENYLVDEMLRSAVERQFEIIGEALSRRYRRPRSVERAAQG